METNQAPTGKISIGPLSASGDSREVLKLGSAVVVLGLVFYGCKEAISVCGYWVKNQLSRRSAKIDPTPVTAPPTSGSCNETPRVEPKTLNDGFEWNPLRPKYYNPLDPDKSHVESRLFACAIHKGDIGVVVAAKGVGKTTLFMQIGNAIAAGKSTGLWPQYDEGEHKPQRVLYYDGELSGKDMYDRYYSHCFEFAEKFERYDRSQFRNINDILLDLKSKQTEINEDCTIIIDNVTKLCETAQTDKIKLFNDGIESLHAAFSKKGVA